ncbi:MAG TPA: cyclic nucleotide-binding domain-containing protein [Thermoanaerobaculia bacterium]|nr:cyclic nucleotide-binding domain-containing protein [Thermoanaerobaculia bacterium]
METLAPILAAHPFFRDLATPHLDLVVGCASNVRFSAGAFMFHEGDEANRFYVIREGRVAVDVSIPGRDPVVVETVEHGEVLGWSWLFPPHVSRFNARVVEPVRAIALDGKCLRTKCENNPELGYQMMSRFARLMQNRISALTLQLTDVYAAV